MLDKEEKLFRKTTLSSKSAFYIFFWASLAKKKNPSIKEKTQNSLWVRVHQDTKQLLRRKFDGGSATNILWRHIMYKTYPDEKN